MKRNTTKKTSTTTRKYKQNKPIVHPISQVVLKLSKDNTPSVFEKAREVVLMWMKQLAGVELPDKALRGQSFNLDEDAAQPAEAVAVDDEEFRYWRARIRAVGKEVPGRTWITEIAIGEVKEGPVTFCSRLRCRTHGIDIPDRSIPRFVRELIQNQTTYLDEHPASTSPWLINSQDKVDMLCKLLTSPDRRSEVLVFSLLKDSTDRNQTALLYQDVEDIAGKIAGAAHVAVITGPASFWLSDRVGEEFSVFQQAVRTYRPGFDPDIDEPFRHPLVLPNRIHEQEDDEWLKNLLISGAIRGSIFHNDIEQYLPPFTKIRSLENEKIRRIASESNQNTQRKAGPSDADLLKLAEQEIAQMKKDHEKESETFNELLDFAETEKKEALEESAQFKSQNSFLRERVKTLEEKLKNEGRLIQPEIPENLDNFESWCHENLSGFVEIHNRAFRSAKDSKYKDTSLIFKALLLLRDYYVPMKRGEGDENLKKEFESKCSELGISEPLPSFTSSRYGEEGETYFINYAGQRRLLGFHLKKGNSRSVQNCFRLYFFWDDDNENVVVGWLPSHLGTRIT